MKTFSSEDRTVGNFFWLAQTVTFMFALYLTCANRAVVVIYSVSKTFSRSDLFLLDMRPSLFARIVASCLRGSLPKSGPLDFATKNTFPSFFVGEEALAGIY